MTAPTTRKHSAQTELASLRQQLAESRAAFQALAAGQVDSVLEPEGPVLLRAAQEALGRSEQNFRALIEQLPDQVWVHRAGKIIYVNPVATQCLGYPASVLVGRDLLDFFHADEREAAQERIRQGTRVGEKVDRHEVRLCRSDGQTVVLEVSAQGVLFDGEPATLKVAHDITRRKELEAHLLVADRMASIGMLAAGVAHEINNPLAYVIANLRFVAQEGGSTQTWSEEASAAISEAREGAERVRGIVRDLKAFSRAEDSQHGSVDLHRMLDSAANMASNEIRHCARLVKDYSLTPLRVEGNESRLGQVFLNLLVNAAQAIPEGAADRNEVRLVTRAEPDGRVLIEVRDTGSGMAAPVLGRLFTPFFTTKPKGVGTGLGLSICHKIIAAHGGEIRAMSMVGVGTTFRVWLPAEASEPVVVPPPSMLPAVRRGRVLVVDDEPLLGKALRRVLVHHHEVVVVGSGADALRHLAIDSKFDVVFCDLMMPQLSGPQVFERIVSDHPQLAPRVVFLSGGAFTEATRSFLDRVPNLRIDKPFEVGQILSVVAQFLLLPPLD